MTFALAYWIIIFLWLIFGLASYRGLVGTYGFIGNSLMLFILFLILGWRVFGAPIHG